MWGVGSRRQVPVAVPGLGRLATPARPPHSLHHAHPGQAEPGRAPPRRQAAQAPQALQALQALQVPSLRPALAALALACAVVAVLAPAVAQAVGTTEATPRLAYAGYEGGPGDDHVVGFGVDANGNQYLATVGAGLDVPDAACPAAVRCVSIVKLSPTGAVLAGAALVGGELEGPASETSDIAFAVAADGTVALAVTSRAGQWPVSADASPSKGQGSQVYVAFIDSDLHRLHHTRFLDTPGDDSPRQMAWDGDRLALAFLAAPLPSAGSANSTAGAQAHLAYFTRQGATLSGLWPVADAQTRSVDGLALQPGRAALLFSSPTTSWVNPLPAMAGWGSDARLAVVDLARGAPTLLSPVPASAAGHAAAVTFDSAGLLVLGRDTPPAGARPSGTAQSEGAPAPGSIQLTALDANAATVVWSTWLGGSGADRLTGLALRADGAVVATGTAVSQDFPTSANAPRRELAGPSDPGDAFAIDLAGSRIAFATLVGGSGLDAAARGRGLWSCSDAVALESLSPDLATATARRAAPVGGRDAAVALVAQPGSPCDALPAFATATPCPQTPLSLQLTALPDGSAPRNVTWRLGDGAKASGAAVIHAYPAAGLADVVATAEDAAGQLWSVASVVHTCLGLLGPPGTSHLRAQPADRAPPPYATDSDHDGVADGGDDCPAVANVDQRDSDGDGLGDACDATPGSGAATAPKRPADDLRGPYGLADDRDLDGVADTADNCPDDPNRAQRDLDQDSVGDACDPDIDNDGVLDRAAPGDAKAILDDCPTVPDPGQLDSDRDGMGDACDANPCRNAALEALGLPEPAATCAKAGFPGRNAGTPAAVASGRDSASAAILWIAAGAVAVGGLAVVGARRWGRLLPFGALGFSRILPDQLLENPARRRIVELVAAEPGLHPQAIVRHLGLGRGTVEHHLRLLEKSGHIRGKKVGGRTCYFASGQVDARIQPATVTLRPVLARSMLAEIIRSPGLSLTDLATRLGCSYGAVLYHADRLEEAQLVRRDRNAGMVKLVPLALGEQALGVLGVKVRPSGLTPTLASSPGRVGDPAGAGEPGASNGAFVEAEMASGK